MLRKCLSIISILAYVTASSAPAAAAGPLGGAGYDPFDIHHRSLEITPGAYLRIPFSGSIRRSVADSRLGLTLAARLPGQYGYRGRLGVLDTPKFIDLSVGLEGRDSLRLNGYRLVDTDALSADEDGKTKKKKGHIWPWIVGGLAVTVVGGVLAAKSAGKTGGRAISNAICNIITGENCKGN